MRYIDNNCTDPYFNLALEEYLLREVNGEYFVLWRDEPCIVVGKNQNTLSEINEEYIKKHDIKVVRRQSGGGAVFHDLGNLNFTFIVEDDGKKFNNFETFVIPIIGVLNELGVKAEFSGRNDLLIDGKKFSGNAQCKYKNRVMHHGTLLFSSDIVNLSDALISKPIKFSDKAVKSVSSRITNISEHLQESFSVIDFKNKIFEYIGREEKDKVITTLDNEEIEAVKNLVKTKYETWQWNFGQSPKYNFYNEKKLSAGTIELSIDVEKGIMQHIRIFGDFFGEGNIEDIEKALIGKKHNTEEIHRVIDNINIKNYFGNIDKEDFLELFLYRTI
ncbi:MAG: lipoate--protein ligase [Clostridium sulfidigenes]|uniref:lipoate--protein ligase n=1 Tax=Clostridium sulfidigenes TaxID=318464 RepID=A0A927ZJX5_9CLOT|nr:lipoate--protein ligase [Clostridium sulfidigenes]